MNTQSTLDLIGKNFKALLLAAALYPLDRIQSIQQVQSTYANQTIKNSQNILGEAVHYGRRSYFRGFMPFISKSALVTVSVKVTDLGAPSQQKWSYLDWLTLGLGSLGYAMLYPLEMVNLHMSVEVERQRYYGNVRECLSKIKKNEGVKALFRGFYFSIFLFGLQLSTVRYARKEFESRIAPFSEWEKIGLLLALVSVSELLFYPLNTVKKLFQINGAIGHTDKNFSISRTIGNNTFLSLYRGIGTRIINVGVYAGLYCWLLGQESQ